MPSNVVLQLQGPGQEALEWLRIAFEWEPGVAAAIGSAKASLIRKVQALCHSQRLTTMSWEHVARLMNSTVSWTGDLGTESGMWRFSNHLANVFGPWIADKRGFHARDLDQHDFHCDFDFNVSRSAPELISERQPDGDDKDDMDEPMFEFKSGASGGCGDVEAEPRDIPTPEIMTPVESDVDESAASAPAAWAQHSGDFELPMDPLMLDMRNSIFIPGVLHVIHNMTEKLSESLDHYDRYLEYLKHVCRLLSRRWSKDRLKENCFKNHLKVYEPLLEQFNAEVYEGRWGSVLHAVSELLPMRSALQAGWSKARFGGAVHESADGKSMKLDVADWAIHSNWFWGYTVMLSNLGEMVEHVAHWAESCPCHSKVRSFRGEGGRRRQLPVRCPLQGCQAPACAAGYLFELLSHIFRSASSYMFLHPVLAACTEEERVEIMSDFGRAKSHFQMWFQLKFSHWSELPWICIGISHWNKVVARNCAARALELFQKSPSDNHHPVSKLLCQPGTPGHAAMSAFASGDLAITESPLLFRFCGRFRFIPVSERWIEGRHHLAAQAFRLAPHGGPVHLAYNTCSPLIVKRIQRDPAFINELARHLEEIGRNVLQQVEAFGFARHPTAQRIRGQIELRSGTAKTSISHIRSSKLESELLRILYHVDPGTLHGDLPTTAGGVGRCWGCLRIRWISLFFVGGGMS